MTKEQDVDLAKSVDELNNVINKDAEVETGIEADLNKAQDLIEDEMNDGSDSDVDTDVDTDINKSMDDDLVAPQVSEVEEGTVDAGEFLEKSLAYMEGVSNLVKSLKVEISDLRKENSDLKKSNKVTHSALGALVKSQKELHKSMKLADVAPAKNVVEFDRGEQIAPSAAQMAGANASLNKGEEVVEDEIQKKNSFDDAEINLLAKALRERTITEAEYKEAQQTFVLPKRLFN